MEILLGLGFWILVFVYLIFIHVALLGIVSVLATIPINLIGLKDKTAGIIGANIGAAIALYGFAYNKLWELSFDEPAPIIFYVLGLVAAWFGSGSDTVEANIGNKLMTSGEVTGILICIVIAFVNGAVIF